MAVYGIEWVRRKGGGVPEVQEYKEGTSETFLAGQPVIYDTSEDGIVAATEGNTAMLGIALANASGVAGTLIPVLVPTPADVFSATISNAGANLAAAHATNNIGVLLSYLASTESGQTGKITIDEADLTNHWVKVEGMLTNGIEPIGTAGGRCLFTFLGAILDSEVQA